METDMVSTVCDEEGGLGLAHRIEQYYAARYARCLPHLTLCDFKISYFSNLRGEIVTKLNFFSLELLHPRPLGNYRGSNLLLSLILELVERLRNTGKEQKVASAGTIVSARFLLLSLRSSLRCAFALQPWPLPRVVGLLGLQFLNLGTKGLQLLLLFSYDLLILSI